ncbi:MAG: hypothetical protein WCF85_20550, partial [Rhodospirillaceae bacterium]
RSTELPRRLRAAQTLNSLSEYLVTSDQSANPQKFGHDLTKRMADELCYAATGKVELRLMRC